MTEPFTRARLLELVVQFGDVARTLSGIDLSMAERMRLKAEFAADHLGRNGIESVANIGEFHSTMVAGGDRVRLKKGAIVRSTNPQYPRDGRPNGVTRTLTVFDTDKGFIDPFCETIREATITWVGSGGYWYETDLNNVEPIN